MSQADGGPQKRGSGWRRERGTSLYSLSKSHAPVLTPFFLPPWTASFYKTRSPTKTQPRSAFPFSCYWICYISITYIITLQQHMCQTQKAPEKTQICACREGISMSGSITTQRTYPLDIGRRTRGGGDGGCRHSISQIHSSDLPFPVTLLRHRTLRASLQDTWGCHPSG